jgi:prepilin-type N-terminal cleavage/methylation domain-containing protein
MHSKWERGFTVIELMIVMLIVGMITSLTVPKLRTGLRQRAVRSAGNDFVLVHSFARSTALRYGRTALLRIDASGGRYWVEVDTSGTGVRDTVGVLRDLSNTGVQMSSTQSVMCFDARGLAAISATCSSGGAVIVFASQGWADTVRLTTLSKVLR